jgi:hypothetical protein
MKTQNVIDHSSQDQSETLLLIFQDCQEEISVSIFCMEW